MKDAITVYRARKIITMDHNRPEVTHVACRNGRILCAGSLEEVSAWGSHTLDDRYADKVMLPGLIEAHAHVMAGGVWGMHYVGHYERTGPDGRVHKAKPRMDDVIDELRAVATKTPVGKPILAWGIDPNIMDGPRLSKRQLDSVSTEHPVILFHSNFHLMTSNTKVLEDAGYTAGTNIEGVMKDPDGQPNGELQEFVAMFPVMESYGVSFSQLCEDPNAVRNYGHLARVSGCTTVADLFSVLANPEVANLLEVTGDPAFPARYHPVMDAMRGPGPEMAARALELKDRSTNKLWMGAAKLFTDGAIQGFTAQLKEPGYLNGNDCGIWNMEIDHFKQTMKDLHEAGVQTHIHTNGDAASQLGIDAIREAILAGTPDADHRHVLEHSQLADMAQFKQMKALGICVNLFANHIHYFGDVHYTQTVGPDRAQRMNAFRDALDAGVPMAFHSDAPITPLAPLFSAWIACNRQTMGGRILGEYQCLTVPQALYAITMGAAYVLKMDHVVGSISAGKFADFCVLDDDPLTRPKQELKDIGIHATVLSGMPTEAP